MNVNSWFWFWIFIAKCHQSVVDKVEDDLKDAAEDGGQGEPQVHLIGSGMGLIFLLFCPDKSGQEVVSWVDLTH